MNKDIEILLEDFTKKMLEYYGQRATTNKFRKELASSERKEANAMKDYNMSLAAIQGYFEKTGGK
jgi:hypothetical protein